MGRVHIIISFSSFERCKESGVQCKENHIAVFSFSNLTSKALLQGLKRK